MPIGAVALLIRGRRRGVATRGAGLVWCRRKPPRERAARWEFAGAKRRLRVIPWGSTALELVFCVKSAAFERDFRGVWRWFSCCSSMKIVAFEHEYCDFSAWIPQLSGANLAAFEQEFGKVFALESSA